MHTHMDYYYLLFGLIRNVKYNFKRIARYLGKINKQKKSVELLFWEINIFQAISAIFLKSAGPYRGQRGMFSQQNWFWPASNFISTKLHKFFIWKSWQTPLLENEIGFRFPSELNHRKKGFFDRTHNRTFVLWNDERGGVKRLISTALTNICLHHLQYA